MGRLGPVRGVSQQATGPRRRETARAGVALFTLRRSSQRAYRSRTLYPSPHHLMNFVTQLGQRFAPAAVALLALAAQASAQICPGSDMFAPNHSCTTAMPMTVSIIQAELVVKDTEADYFRISSDAQSELYIRAEFVHAQGDIDLVLYRDDQCDVGPPLETSAGVGNVESIKRAADFGFLLKVYRAGGPGDCSEYRLTITKARTQTLGGTICKGFGNSTGWWANLRATGSTNLSTNNFALNVGFLPQDSFGHFINSRGEGYFTPPGSVGQLCINQGGIGRFIRPGEILNSGTGGGVSLPIDLTSIPRPTGTVAIQPGEGYAFQYWYRDTSNGQAVSNFSNAVIVWFD